MFCPWSIGHWFNSCSVHDLEVIDLIHILSMIWRSLIWFMFCPWSGGHWSYSCSARDLEVIDLIHVLSMIWRSLIWFTFCPWSGGHWFDSCSARDLEVIDNISLRTENVFDWIITGTQHTGQNSLQLSKITMSAYNLEQDDCGFAMPLFKMWFSFHSNTNVHNVWFTLTLTNNAKLRGRTTWYGTNMNMTSHLK